MSPHAKPANNGAAKTKTPLDPEQTARVVAEMRAKKADALAQTLLRNALKGDALAQPVSPPNLLVPRYGIGQGRCTALVAYGGVGKTWLAIDLALAVASDATDCWGRSDMIGDPGLNNATTVLDRRTVLHLDYEMGANLITKRYQRVAFGRGIDLRDLRDRLAVVSFAKVNLTTPSIEDGLLRACESVSLCIIDSFRAAAPGVDENASDSREYLDLLTRVSDKTGTAFVVLFHEGKQAGNDRPQGQRMRGSSALFDAAGSVLSVEPDDDDMVVTQTKASSGRPGYPHRVRLLDVGAEQTDWWLTEGIKLAAVDAEQKKNEREAQAAKAHEAALSRAMQNVRDVLAKEGELGLTQLRPRISGAKNIAQEAIERLEATGEILRPTGGPGVARPYRLAKPPKAK